MVPVHRNPGVLGRGDQLLEHPGGGVDVDGHHMGSGNHDVPGRGLAEFDHRLYEVLFSLLQDSLFLAHVDKGLNFLFNMLLRLLLLGLGSIEPPKQPQAGRKRIGQNLQERAQQPIAGQQGEDHPFGLVKGADPGDQLPEDHHHQKHETQGRRQGGEVVVELRVQVSRQDDGNGNAADLDPDIDVHLALQAAVHQLLDLPRRLRRQLLHHSPHGHFVGAAQTHLKDRQHRQNQQKEEGCQQHPSRDHRSSLCSLSSLRRICPWSSSWSKPSRWSQP